MKVRDLLEILNQADPESIVLYMTQYADTDESDEVREVDIPTELWTYERGRYGGSEYEAHYPGTPEPRADRYSDVVCESERVVVLSDGPTNLRFESR
jgi:hypothetical protein